MSKKIPVSDFIAEFETMVKENWTYKWGGASKGCVDCSGAFTYAARKLGNLSISHSSNQIPRKYIKKLLPISEAKPGYAILRHKDKFETDDLARKYNDGLGNFNHIGLVSRDGKHVLEAKGSKYGSVETKLDNGWYKCGPLDFIDYGEEKEAVVMPDIPFMFTVDVGEDSWLNVREDHGTNKKVLARLHKGDAVCVVDTYDNWSKIVWEDGFAWVYTKYLKPIEDTAQQEPAEEEFVPFVYRFIITDEAGNKFYPVGGFTTDVEFIQEE